eukprot:342260-Rhodomonas_salina.2
MPANAPKSARKGPTMLNAVRNCADALEECKEAALKITVPNAYVKARPGRAHAEEAADLVVEATAADDGGHEAVATRAQRQIGADLAYYVCLLPDDLRLEGRRSARLRDTRERERGGSDRLAERVKLIAKTVKEACEMERDDRSWSSISCNQYLMSRVSSGEG